MKLREAMESILVEKEDVETLIRDTYFDITMGRTNVPVMVADIRKYLPSISHRELDAALKKMLFKLGVILYPEDYMPSRTKEMVKGALDLNGEMKHWIKLER